MYSAGDTPKGWVAPFGYPRIKACSRLPMAFRSVPRPSSPPGAKASTECPYRAPYASITPEGSIACPPYTETIVEPVAGTAYNPLKNALHYSSFIALLSTHTNASDHYRHTGLDDPECSRIPIPSGQTNDPMSRRTDPAAIQPGTKMPDEPQPSCPTRPETHQNQIHSNKRTNTIRPRPAATPHGKTA